MVQLNIDCEGPITQNDNAFELCEELIPQGGDFFSRVSRYDDYLAEVERRPGYKAGDTLKLVLPFLKAYGATDKKMEEFSRKTLVLLKGAKEMLSQVASLMPTFIISTSYEPYLKALCAVTGFPVDQVYCTAVNLDKYQITGKETEKLKRLAQEIAEMPILEWPDGATGSEDLDIHGRKILARLNEIFWTILPSMKIGRVLNEVNPIGGVEKARAVEKSLSRTGKPVSEVFYVGDSITDIQALELVSQGGGIPMSFNGNKYAIRAARWACISHNTAIIAAIARFLQLQGMNALEDIVDSSLLEGRELLNRLAEKGVEKKYLIPLENDQSPAPPKLICLERVDVDAVIQESEGVRKSVRGLSIGELG